MQDTDHITVHGVYAVASISWTSARRGYICVWNDIPASSGLTEVTNVDVRADRGVVGMDRYYRTLVHIAG